MRHLFAGFIPANLPGRAGLESERFHLLGPLLVVITAPTWLAVMRLPHVDHFMGQRGQNFLARSIAKVHWIHCQLIRFLTRLPVKTVRRVIRSNPLIAALQGN